MPHPYLVRDEKISALARLLRDVDAADLDDVNPDWLASVAGPTVADLREALALLPEAVAYERARRAAFRLA